MSRDLPVVVANLRLVLCLLLVISGHVVQSRTAGGSKGKKANNNKSLTNGGLPSVTCFVCSSNVPSCTETYFVSGGTPTKSTCQCCKKYLKGNLTERACVLDTADNAVQLCLPYINSYSCTADYCNGTLTSRLNTWRHLANVFAAIFGLIAVEFLQSMS